MHLLKLSYQQLCTELPFERYLPSKDSNKQRYDLWGQKGKFFFEKDNADNIHCLGQRFDRLAMCPFGLRSLKFRDYSMLMCRHLQEPFVSCRG